MLWRWRCSTLVLLESSTCLKVVDAFEVLHSAPHDANLIGQHVTLLVKDSHNHRFLDKPEKDGVLGIGTGDCRMVGTNNSTELSWLTVVVYHMLKM